MGGLCGKTRRRPDGSGAGQHTVKNVENDSDVLQKGLDFLHVAVKEDKNRNYEEALRCYVQGTILVGHSAKYTIVSQKLEDIKKNKCKMYIRRMKRMKDYTNENDLNQIYGEGVDLDELETMLSDPNVLYLVTEIISICGKFMEFDDE